MPPGLPPAIPANIFSSLSAIRSSVFATTHNPTGARLGNKYAKKQLAGPAITSYYPKPMPSAAQMQKMAARMFQERERAYLKNGGSEYALNQWKTEGQVAPGFLPTPKIPAAILHDGHFFDAKEQDRLSTIQKRKRLGKGTPKKGQGKRTQMGGKKR